MVDGSVRVSSTLKRGWDVYCTADTISTQRWQVLSWDWGLYQDLPSSPTTLLVVETGIKSSNLPVAGSSTLRHATEAIPTCYIQGIEVFMKACLPSTLLVVDIGT